jgi:glycine hydroxymethyltransferase
MMIRLKNDDPQVWQAIQEESERQQNTIDLIASENICSPAVQEAQGSSMTNNTPKVIQEGDGMRDVKM